MGSITQHSQQAVVTFQSQNITVIDTPDIENNLKTDSQKRAEIMQWRSLAGDKPTLVLLAIRYDVRYTAEEYAIFRRIISLWGGDSLQQSLVLVFTYADRQDQDIEEQLQTVCPELKSVLKDAKNQYICFDKTDEQSSWKLLNKLLQLAKTRTAGKQTKPDTCSITVTFLLVTLLCIAVCACFVCLLSGQTAGAYTSGILGLLLVVVLVSIVCAKLKRNFI